MQGQDFGCGDIAAFEKKGGYGRNERGDRRRAHDLPCPGLFVVGLASLNRVDCPDSRHRCEAIDDIFICHHCPDGTKSSTSSNEASFTFNDSTQPCEFGTGQPSSNWRWSITARTAPSISGLICPPSTDLAYRFGRSPAFTAVTEPLRPVCQKHLRATRACPFLRGIKTVTHLSILSLHLSLSDRLDKRS